MNKRILQLVLFLLVIFTADRMAGFLLKKLYDNSKSLDIAKIRYTINSTNQDILIFGSSRAQHHYIPDTIKKYTGESAYNCGIGGQGLEFSYIQIHETLKRYNPKLIVLDLSPNILFDPLSHQKLNVLLPYHSKDKIIEDVLTNGSLIEKSKFISDIYPYNGTPFTTLSAYVYYRPDYEKGYIPITGTIDQTTLKEDKYSKDQRFDIPKKQVHFLSKIIDACKDTNINLIFVISPIFKESEEDKQIIEQLDALAQSNSIQLVNFSDNLNFSQHPELFKDNLHLNQLGAANFSASVCCFLKGENFKGSNKLTLQE